MGRHRIILCTGIDNKTKLGKIEEIDKLSHRKVAIYNVGDYMVKEANKADPSVPKENLVNLPERKKYRSAACEQIKREVDEGEAEVAIISTRATYWHGGISQRMVLMDESHDCIKPEFCINVIDDIQIMYENMRHDARWKDSITLDKLLDWRDYEFEITEDYWVKWSERNNIAKIKTYLLPAQEPAETLLDLLFSKKKKVYLSFPISFRLEKEKFEERRKVFLKKLREHFVVFDPFSIKEYDKRDEFADDKLKREIGHKTVNRDFELIEQCDMIVVYYPTEEVYTKTTKDLYEKSPELEAGILKFKSGEEIHVKADEGISLSAGVITEMVHATNKGKRTYALWFSNKPPSPFFSYHCTATHGKLFPGPDAERDFFKNIEDIKAK